MAAIIPPLTSMFWCNYSNSAAGGASVNQYYALLVERSFVAAIYTFCPSENNVRCLRRLSDAVSNWITAQPPDSVLEAEEEERDEAGLPRRPDTDYVKSAVWYGQTHGAVKIKTAEDVSPIGETATFAACWQWARHNRWFVGSGYFVNGELDERKMIAALTSADGASNVLLGIDQFMLDSPLTPQCTPLFVEAVPNASYHVVQHNYEGNRDHVLLIDGRAANDQSVVWLRDRMIKHGEYDDGWKWEWLTKAGAPVSEANARRLVAQRVGATRYNFPEFTFRQGQMDISKLKALCTRGTPFNLSSSVFRADATPSQ